MDDQGMSLIRASQVLKIPYTVAKQILFTYGTNSAIARSTISAKLSPRQGKFHPSDLRVSDRRRCPRLSHLPTEAAESP